MSDAPMTPEFTVTLSPHQRWPKKATQAEMIDGANLVLPGLLSYLEAPLPLDGARRIEIRLGSAGDDPRYQRVDETQSIVYQPAFDLEAWKAATEEEQDAHMLEALGGIVDRLAHAFRGDRRGLKKARKQAAKKGFETRYRVARLCTEVPDEIRGQEIHVLRRLGRGGDDWVAELKGKKGSVLLKDEIASGLRLRKARQRFRKAAFEDGAFVIFGEKGNANYRLDVAEIMEARAA